MPTSDQSNALGRAKELAGKLTPIQKITLGAVLLTALPEALRYIGPLQQRWLGKASLFAGWRGPIRCSIKG